MKTTDGMVILCIAAIVFAVGGCAEERNTNLVDRICLSQTSMARAMDVSQDVLGRMHFRVAKVDADQGYIRTRPLRAAQFFELWRSDNVGQSSSLEANLHTIRRTVELKMSEDQGRLCIDCNVRAERLSMPERETPSTGRAYRLFSKSTSGEQSLMLEPEQQEQMAWIELGKDQLLASEILKRIQKNISKAGQEKSK